MHRPKDVRVAIININEAHSYGCVNSVCSSFAARLSFIRLRIFPHTHNYENASVLRTDWILRIPRMLRLARKWRWPPSFAHGGASGWRPRSCECVDDDNNCD